MRSAAIPGAVRRRLAAGESRIRTISPSYKGVVSPELSRRCRNSMHRGCQVPRARKRAWLGSAVSLWAKPLPRRRVCTRRLFRLTGLTGVPFEGGTDGSNPAPSSAESATNRAVAWKLLRAEPVEHLVLWLMPITRTREAGHARRCLDMHGIEGCAAALDVKADGIDGTIGAEERRRDRGLVTDVSFRNLAPRIWSGCRSNPLGVARCCPHLEAVVKQMMDDPATEKPGSAENRYEPAMAGCVVFKVFCQDAQACLRAAAPDFWTAG